MDDSGIYWVIIYMSVLPIMSGLYSYVATFFVSKGFIKIYSKKKNYAEVIEEQRRHIGKVYAIANAIFVFVSFGLGFLVFTLVEESVLGMIILASRLAINIIFVIYLYRKPFQLLEGSSGDKLKVAILYVVAILILTLLLSSIF